MKNQPPNQNNKQAKNLAKNEPTVTLEKIAKDLEAGRAENSLTKKKTNLNKPSTDDLNPLSLYFKDLKGIRFNLSREEELKLTKHVKSRKKNTKKELIEASLLQVVGEAKKYQYLNSGLTLSDLIQEGNIGVLRAIETFDYKLGYRFSSYAKHWIKQSISYAINNQAKTVRLPMNLEEKLQRLNKTENYLATTLGRAATDKELADNMNVKPIKIKELKELRFTKSTISLSEPIGPDGEETSLEQCLSNPETKTPEDMLIEAERQEIWPLVDAVLNEKAKEIIQLRFKDGKTLQTIGKKIRRTRERVRQIEFRSLKKLQHPKYKAILEQYL